MAVLILSDIEKADVVDLYTNHPFNQTQLAAMYQVGRRTIQRVLEDAGVLFYFYKDPSDPVVPRGPVSAASGQMRMNLTGPAANINPTPTYSVSKGLVNASAANDAAPLTFDQRVQVMELINTNGITPEKLQGLMAPMDRKSVQNWLMQITHSELSNIIYSVALNKLGEVREILEAREKAEAEVANG